MYIKIRYVEKYNNPCLRGLLVFSAGGIWLLCVIPILRVSTSLIPWATQLPIPEPLQILIVLTVGPGPIILWMILYPAIVTLIIVAGEWLLQRLEPVTKRVNRRIRHLYNTIVDLNNRW